MATLDQRIERQRKNKQESQAQVNKRIANNYPKLESVFYSIFLGAEINDYRNVESTITKLGECLNNIGVLPLWDSVKVNVNYTTKVLTPKEEERLISDYVDYRTEKALETGSYIKMSVTTLLNNKESDAVEFAFRVKQDYRYLAYVTAKLFLYALDNFCYCDNRISFIEFKLSNKVDEIIKMLK